MFTGSVLCEDETYGPIFMKEPPNRVDFSNTTGAVVECAARGNPNPDVIWVRGDGTAVGDVPGLRQVSQLTPTKPPIAYTSVTQPIGCRSARPKGTLTPTSSGCEAKALLWATSPDYDRSGNSNFNPEADWGRSDGTTVGDDTELQQVLPNGNLVFPPFRAEDYRQEVHAQVYACLARNQLGSIHSRDVNVRAVVSQNYDTDVNKEYVILGNSIVLKCQVPSFVADFIEVLSWHTDDNEDFFPGNDYVVNQLYEAEILTEYVIRGNAAVLKCSIPSFVADFVKVESWIDEEGTVITHSDDLVVSQNYVTEAENEYVIRGNAAIVRCKIPSFVSDFVYVESWIMDDGQILTINNTNTAEVISQPYEPEADNEYVIRGNAAIMKCEVPSFVSDFVFVEMWTDSDGGSYFPGHSEAVLQVYEARVNDEFVLRGNTAILKCIVPSFVADFVHVMSWSVDNETVTPDEQANVQSVVHQSYEPRVIDEDVLRGNSAIVKCSIPSFVADYVNVIEWITDEESLSAFSLNGSDGNYVVSQAYTVNLVEENVLRGNAVILKCLIPSFVTEYVSVASWIISEDDEESEIKLEDIANNEVVSQAYTVNIMEESVLRGNAVILKCHISTFVTEYVSVSSWIISDGDTEELEINADAEENNLVVSQAYTINLMDENVLRGNSAILKCHLPSFVTEYVTVTSWIISEEDDDSQEISVDDSSNLVVSQSYTVNLWEENVLRGNAAILKCHIPSFVTEYVTVTSWIISEGGKDELEINLDSEVNLVVSQAYDVKFWEEYVLRGNAAILKCQIPSFVSEYVSVASWIVSEDDQEQEINIDNSSDLVVSQSYAVNLMEEYVLRGNAAILKCHIPSFVSEYVTVVSWIISEDGAEELDINLESENDLEPVGRVPPKFPSASTTSGFQFSVGTNMAVLCPAQAYPSPMYRTDGQSIAEIPIHGDRAQLYVFFEFMCDITLSGTSVPHAFVQSLLVAFILNLQLATKVEPSMLMAVIASHCCALHKHSQLLPSEPVGLKAPTFSMDFKMAWYVKDVEQGFALLCPAQGYPAPLFRARWIQNPLAQSPLRFRTTSNSLGSLVELVKISLYCAKRKRFLSQYSEPITARAPAFQTTAASFNYEIEASSVGSMLCQAQGYPKPVFRWTPSGALLRASLRPRSQPCSFHKIPPTLSCAQRKDFLCLFQEPTNKIAPRKDSTKNFEGWEVFVVSEGNVAYLTCQVAAYPAPVFRWYKFIDGTTRKQPVALNDRVKQVSGTLIIKEAKVEDSGKYLCVVNNSVGGESVETVLTVTAPLKTSVEPATQTVDFGRPAVFTCKYEGNPVKTITWLKDGKDMQHHDPLLRIESVKKEDKGMYQCFIRNDQESAGASAELKLGGRCKAHLIHHFGEQTLRSGPFLRLKCVASGNPIPEITWLLDGEKLSSGERLQIGRRTADGNVESHLNISSVHTNDGGLYSCIASSKVGSASHSARVNVYGLPYVRPMKKRPIVASDTLVAHCPVAGYPIDSIVWERDGRVLPINRKQKVFPNGTLVIENVERLSDQATYTCVAKNSQGYSARGTLELQVMVPPQILPFEFGEEPANAGDMASISCAISKGDQPLNISWYFNGQFLSRSNDLGIVIVNINKKTSILNIDSVNGVHRGTYHCVAANWAGSANHSAVLNVNVPPQITPFEFGEEILNEGETASVSCVMSKGDLPVTFTWRFNGEQIKPRNSLGIVLTTISKKTSILNIESVSSVHRGSYTCEIKNDAVPPQILPFEFGEEPANAGDTASVQCVMNKGDLPANFSWSLNGRQISNGKNLGIAIGSMSRKMSILNIDSVNGTHRGTYVCRVENAAVLPQIHPFTFGDEPANAGDTVGVQCMVSKGDAPINITWHLNGNPLNDIKGITVTKIGHKSSSLSIDSVASVHRGMYTCLASNQAGHANYSSELAVNVLPQINPFTFGDEPANAGDTVGLQCMVVKGDVPVNITWRLNDRPISETPVAPQVTPFDFGDDILNAGETVSLTCTVGKGDLPLKIHWQLNNEILNSGNGVFINRNGKRISVLSIENVQHEHIGNYTCIAENDAGQSSHSAVLNVNVLPQVAPFDFGEDTYNAGDTVSLTCTITKGDMPIEISWLFNDKPMKSSDGVVIARSGRKISMLSIDSIQGTHRGNYTCVAKNDAGTAAHSALLHVNVAPQIIPFDFGVEPASDQELVVAMCTVTKGDMPLSIMWYFNGKPVKSGSNGIVLTTTKRTSQLTIEAVTHINQGNYTCTVSNQAGTTNHSAELYVNVPPQIMPFEFGEEPVNAQDMVLVTCTALKGDQPLKIEWYFNGTQVKSGDKGVTLMNTKRTSQLSIESVSHQNQGSYSCVVRNDAGSVNHTAQLLVNVPPHIVQFEAEEPVFAGESVQLTCHVSKGDTPLTIAWSFHGKELSSHQGITTMKIGERTSLLTISSATASHSGEYSCHAANRAGLAAHSASVNVHVLPHIVPFEADESVFAGETVQLNCHVSKGDLPLDIKWHFYGYENTTSQLGIMTTKMTSRTSFLSIAAATASHSGNYTCVATNNAGSTNHTTVLNVQVTPNILPFDVDQSLFSGESVQMMCHISKGDTPLDIYWTLNGEALSRELGTFSKVGDRSSVLVLPSVTGAHSGNYTCVAKNRAGMASYTTILKIIVVPHIIPFEVEEQIFAGESVHLTCHVSKGDKPLQITWSFNDKEIPYHNNMGVTTTKLGEKASVLSIPTAMGQHSGNYTCTASNRAGRAHHAALVNIHVPPHIMPFEIEESVYYGESVQMTCHASKGDRPMTITWTFEGQDLSNDNSIKTIKMAEQTSFLSIAAVTGAHSGNYTCIAKNRAGEDRYSTALHVKVVPHIKPFELDEAVFAGESVHLDCHVSKGDTPLNISWTFQGEPVIRRMGVATTTLSARVSVLDIPTAMGTNSGNYTCTATNRAVPPVVQPFSFGEVAMNSGQVVTVPCSVIEGDHPLQLRWLFDDEPIKPRSGATVFNIGERSAILSIGSVSHKHAGNYTCIAENEAGIRSHSSILIINVPPNILPYTFGEKPANFGEYLQAACTANLGDLPIIISWTFNGQLISQRNNDYVITNSKRSSTLIIESVDAKHAGSYVCIGENRAGRASHSTELVVYVPPKIAPFAAGDEPAFLGDYFALQCIITHGDQPVRIEWTVNNRSADAIPGTRVSTIDRRSSVLTIESVDAKHAGLYNCTATNAAGTASHATELVVKVPPLIVPFSFGEVPINPGDAVLVHCLATKGDLPLEISWTFSSETIDSSLHRDITTTQLSQRVSVLSITSVSANHQGNYTCIVQNAAGRAEHVATLIATQVTCLVSEGDQPLDIQWYFEGQSLKENPTVSATKIGQRASLLLIDPAGWSNSGSYTCLARNAAGFSNYTASLEVHVPPRWILEPTDKAFAQGSNAKVECKADGFPKPQVTWKRAGGDTPGDYKDLKPNNPNVKVEDGALNIANIQKTNEGYYLCEAVNGIGSGLSAVILISVQAPPQFEIKMRNQTARRSEPAVLQCQAKGEKPIGIIWNMNNKRLEPKSDPRYTIREEILIGGVVSDLSIRRTERSDSALFTCVATNAFGSDDTSINMIIQEVPEAPYGLKVLDKSGRTVQLSWAAPYDGNSPIKKFLIEYKRAKGSWEKDIDRVLVPGDATEAGVFSLRPATAYHIRIVAENELGTSEPSETVTIITAEEAPTGPPQDVKVDAADKHTLKVTWKPPPPQDWNGELQGYYVGYKLASSNKSFVFETVDISKESGKEHHLDILNLKTYTQYSVVVQAFNKMGSGPVSSEVRAYTAEGAPSAPPQDVLCTTLTAQTIRVSWVSPPLAAANGLIKAYKVVYGPSDTWYDEKTKDTKITASSETILHGLKKFTNYSMEVLATTNGGDGVRSAPIHCQTEQDVPEAPRAVKALVMGSESILVSWRPPAQPNGVVTHYNVYTQAQNAEPHPNKFGRYDFWVTASTIIGEGQPSATASCSPSDKVPAKIASFDESFTATYKEDVKLPCLAVGVPPPNILWKIKGQPLEASERVRQLPEGSLQIAGVAREDAGEYSCHIPSSTDTYTLENLFCGSRYQLYVTAYNGIGTGEASDVVIARTRGSKPPVPRAADFIEVGSSSVTLHLKQWLDGGCPMSHFVVENKKKGAAEWNQISNAVKPGGNFVVLGTIAPAREVGGGSLTTEQTIKLILSHLNLIVPVVAAILVIIIAIVVVCVVRGTRDHHKAWLEPEVLVPILATIVVFIVGVVVICLTLARRNAPHRLRGQKDVYDYDAVYNASQAAMGGGGGTLDKRGGLRDELGYIAPPNRKLPPVPGSNYNTCDRVKRQAVITPSQQPLRPQELAGRPKRHLLHRARVRRPRHLR
ncbi:hypothetical protein MSG28_006118 [Choristoneura fumiferana]|uniref:Uncharacterized protein n=1 Tax=Choristoneura fumiferana TaxID=7141 RepID=A0ACC0JDP4_CHOFU|nr:hypothetical protein MSG28_006118 [Choristoneura fumiferana]